MYTALCTYGKCTQIGKQTSESSCLSTPMLFLYIATSAAPRFILAITISFTASPQRNHLNNLLLQHLNPPFPLQLLPQRLRQLLLHRRQDAPLADTAIQHHQDCNTAWYTTNTISHMNLGYQALCGLARVSSPNQFRHRGPALWISVLDQRGGARLFPAVCVLDAEFVLEEDLGKRGGLVSK